VTIPVSLILYVIYIAPIVSLPRPPNPPYLKQLQEVFGSVSYSILSPSTIYHHLHPLPFFTLPPDNSYQLCDPRAGNLPSKPVCKVA
jgi:hypothetical protein